MFNNSFNIGPEKSPIKLFIKPAYSLQIIPVGGEFYVNGVPQKTFEEILPEIVISRYVSMLYSYYIYLCNCFVQLMFIINLIWNNLDITCVLIGQVCFYSAIKHENDVNDTIGCFEVVKIYIFKKK